MSSRIDLSAFTKVLVLDSQVVLEGRPLEELPWQEIEDQGPILLLCTPTMLAEVDKFKRDGRLGQRARHFNRLIEPSLHVPKPHAINEGPPQVHLAPVSIRRIDWTAVEDLDPDSGDDRIVAEALHARVSAPDRLTLFSYDMRPRAAAARHGLLAIKPAESWLLPPEPNPQQKEHQRLKHRVSELESTQPSLKVELSPFSSMPVNVVRISPLDAEKSELIAAEYLDKNPRSSPGRWEVVRDYSYDGRYDDFKSKVKDYGTNLSESLELLHNQICIRLSLTASGSVGAEHLELQLEGIGALLHDKIVLGPTLLPEPPEYRPGMSIRLPHTISDFVPQRVGRHEFVFDPPLERTPEARLACEDFRHGRVYQRRVYAPILSSQSSPAFINYRLTAANMRGAREGSLRLNFDVEDLDVHDIVNFEENTFKREFPLFGMVEDAHKMGDLSELDLSSLSSD